MLRMCTWPLCQPMRAVLASGLRDAAVLDPRVPDWEHGRICSTPNATHLTRLRRNQSGASHSGTFCRQWPSKTWRPPMTTMAQRFPPRLHLRERGRVVECHDNSPWQQWQGQPTPLSSSSSRPAGGGSGGSSGAGDGAVYTAASLQLGRSKNPPVHQSLSSALLLCIGWQAAC